MPVKPFLWAAGSPFTTTENKGTDCQTGNLSVPTGKNWRHICDPPPMRAPDFTACTLRAVLCLASLVLPNLILLLYFIYPVVLYALCMQCEFPLGTMGIMKTWVYWDMFCAGIVLSWGHEDGWSHPCVRRLHRHLTPRVAWMSCKWSHVLLFQRDDWERLCGRKGIWAEFWKITGI